MVLGNHLKRTWDAGIFPTNQITLFDPLIQSEVSPRMKYYCVGNKALAMWDYDAWWCLLCKQL